MAIPWPVLLGVAGLIAHAAVAQYRITALESKLAGHSDKGGHEEMDRRMSVIEDRVFLEQGEIIVTFPATERTLHEHVTDTRAAAARLRARILALKNESARASVNTEEFISLHSTITDRIAEWDAVVLITGIDTYAATMYPDRVGRGVVDRGCLDENGGRSYCVLDSHQHPQQPALRCGQRRSHHGHDGHDSSSRRLSNRGR